MAPMSTTRAILDTNPKAGVYLPPDMTPPMSADAFKISPEPKCWESERHRVMRRLTGNAQAQLSDLVEGEPVAAIARCACQCGVSDMGKVSSTSAPLSVTQIWFSSFTPSGPPGSPTYTSRHITTPFSMTSS